MTVNLLAAAFSAIVVFGASLSFGASKGPQKMLPYNYTQDDLPNGLRLITVPTDFPRIVAVYIVVQTGSRNEIEPGHTGFAHLFEHVMFKGTERFPEAKYESILGQMGASSNASTGDDFTVYHTTFSKEDLETVLTIEADRFQNLKYSEAEFKTETLAVLGEYNKNSASPDRKMAEVLRETAFDRHTYKHTAMGFLSDIQDMLKQYDYSLKFFDRYYRPEYTTILVVGDVKPKSVRDVVEKQWGAWKRGSYVPNIPTEPVQDSPRTSHVDWPNATLPLVTIAYKGPAYADSIKDSAALEALALLEFSPTSDLYQRLAIREQKVDQLAAGADRKVDAFLFEIEARVKKAEDVPYVQERVLEVVEATGRRPVPEARLDAVRKHLRYSASQEMEDSDAIASLLTPFLGLRRTPETMERYYAQLAQLTPADIQAAAAKYMVSNNRTIVTLTAAGKER